MGRLVLSGAPLRSRALRFVSLLLLACVLGAVTFTAPRPAVSVSRVGEYVPAVSRATATAVFEFAYRTHDGRDSTGYVMVPRRYRRGSGGALPLVIAPHGRGLTALESLASWSDLPTRGGFAVVAPDGQGRRLGGGYSWGYSGQIDDLARMPRLVRRALPWVRLDPRRVYAVGGSMGGQEALLLAARYPRLLAGVAAFDSVTDLALDYRNFTRLRCNAVCLRQWKEPIGVGLQALARLEVGGSPQSFPRAYAARSPLAFAPALARGGVSIELWWSRSDGVVAPEQSRRLFQAILRLNPKAPVEAFVGTWRHSAEFSARGRLPEALALLGLMPTRFERRLSELRRMGRQAGRARLP
jgi:poly(3-hydroxybutyrate) depolymerase